MWVVLAVIIFMIALLSIPLRFSASGRLAREWEGKGEASWAAGLVAVDVTLQEKERPAVCLRLAGWRKRMNASGRTSAKKSSKPPTGRTKRSNLNLAKWFNLQIGREMLGFAERIWRSLHLELKLQGEYGLDDPAGTGFLAALIALANSRFGSLALYPNFEDEVIDIQGSIRGRFIPAQVLWYTAGLMFSKPLFRLWWNRLIPKFKIREVVGNV
jgi:hypothetical protein